MENKLEDCVHDIGDAVFEVLAERFDSEYENVRTEDEYAPYGDGQCVAGRYIDEDDDCRIRENFEAEYDFDTVMELLKNDEDFKKAVIDMVEYVAWNREK